MKVYIQATADGIPHNYNFFNAYQGFREMGIETVMFHEMKTLKNSNPEDIVVGYVDVVRSRLMDFGVCSGEIDYPKELKKYLGREIWETSLSQISNFPERWPVFIKPIENKKFTGVVVRSTKDLIGCGTYGEDTKITCSSVVNFVAEWRCFVRYGKVLDVKFYRGDWRVHYDSPVIEKALKDFVNAPNAFAMDFGVTDDGRTLLIEVNDGYSLGCYGLFCIDYAKLLSARWAQLTQTKDECAFDIF